MLLRPFLSLRVIFRQWVILPAGDALSGILYAELLLTALNITAYYDISSGVAGTVIFGGPVL